MVVRKLARITYKCNKNSIKPWPGKSYRNLSRKKEFYFPRGLKEQPRNVSPQDLTRQPLNKTHRGSSHSPVSARPFCDIRRCSLPTGWMELYVPLSPLSCLSRCHSFPPSRSVPPTFPNLGSREYGGVALLEDSSLARKVKTGPLLPNCHFLRNCELYWKEKKKKGK